MPKHTIDLDGLSDIRARKLVVGPPGAAERDSLDDYEDVGDGNTSTLDELRRRARASLDELTEELADVTDTTPEEIEKGAGEIDIEPPEDAEYPHPEELESVPEDEWGDQ